MLIVIGSQQLLPDLEQCRFDVIARRNEITSFCAGPVRRREAGTIQFAVGSLRKMLIITQIDGTM